jgi:L-ascorbate metabolism protein UlaG (beta-lactamase superfamily)
MDLTYLGAGCVKLSGKSLTVVCDPLKDDAVMAKASAKADVVTVSQENMNGVVSSGMIVDGPGEYEVKGAMITGVPVKLHIDEDGQRCTMFSISMDGVNVVVVGNMFGKLSSSQVEKLGRVDVLVVPVGNHGLTLDAEGAVAVIGQLEPSYVVPVHYDDGHTKYEMPQDGVDVFLKEMGLTVEPVAKLKVSPRDLPEQPQVVVLQRVA